MTHVAFTALQGKTVARIIQDGAEQITFVTTDGIVFDMKHEQDCCESVYVEDVTGDLDDILGHRIEVAEERESDDEPPEYADSWTWTFYEIRTVAASVTIRWMGESNGYYSEGVDFMQRESPWDFEDDETWTVAGDLSMSRGNDSTEARYRAYFELGGT